MPRRASFPLQSLRFQRVLSDRFATSSAFGDFALSNVPEKGLSRNLELALDTRCRSKGSVALEHLLRKNSCISLNVVDVLSVVGQQLPLVLQQLDESMGWGEFLLRRKNVFGDGEEDARIFSENLYVKHLLGVTQAQVLQL